MNKFTFISLTDKEFDKLPYKQVKESFGVTDTKKNTAYIRVTPDYEENKNTFHHELEELINDASYHETPDEPGVRYKSFFSKIGDWVEKTFVPEKVKEVVAETPILNDIVSRGWLGPLTQRLTEEGKEASDKGTGTSKLVNMGYNAALGAIPGVGPLLAAGYGIGSAPDQDLMTLLQGGLQGYGLGSLGAGVSGGIGGLFNPGMTASGNYIGGTTNPSMWESLLGGFKGGMGEYLNAPGLGGLFGVGGKAVDLLGNVGSSLSSGGSNILSSLFGGGETSTGAGTSGASNFSLDKLLLSLFGGGNTTGTNVSGTGSMINPYGTGSQTPYTYDQYGNLTYSTPTNVTSSNSSWQNILNSLFGGGGNQPQMPGGGQKSSGNILDTILGTIGQGNQQQGGGGLSNLLKLLGIGGSIYGQSKQAEEQKDWLNAIQQPQIDLSKQLGGVLGEEVSQPYSMSPEEKATRWGETKTKVEDIYKPIEQKATERFAGAGMIGQGPAMQYFQNLDVQKVKTLEDAAVAQALWEFEEERVVNQNRISNALSYMGRGGTPQYTGSNFDYSTLLSLLMGNNTNNMYAGLF